MVPLAGCFGAAGVRVVTCVASVVACAAGPITASGQLPAVPSTARAAPTPMVLGALLRVAERQSPRTQAARALAAAAVARVPGTRRPPDPQLQFGFMNYDLARFAPMDQVGMNQLQLMQMVPVAGKLGLAGQIAESQARAQDFRAREMGWEVRNQTAAVFYDLYQVDHTLTVTRETRRLIEDIAQIAEAMYRVGDGRQADVLRARVEVAKMTGEIVRMEAMRAAQAARLNAVLNNPADSAVGVPARPVFPGEVPARDSLLGWARQGRALLRAADAQVVAADHAAQLARREIWPDLQVGIQYGQRPGMAGGTDRMGSLMLGASVPIFAGSRQLPMRVEAAAMRAMAEADLAAMWADTRGRIGELVAELQRARSLAQLYRATVLPQAEATVSSALAAYRVGSIPLMSLLDDRMTVNRYRQELFALEADEGKAWAELEMLVGRALLDPDLVQGEPR